jgi:hypothetical protein
MQIVRLFEQLIPTSQTNDVISVLKEAGRAPKGP